MRPAISIRGLRKRYGDRPAVDGVDLDVACGEVFALLGPNGAGKTTTVEILEGYRHRDAGEVAVLGTDPERGDARWRSRIGVVLQTTGAFDELTVAELVGHFAAFYPAPMEADAAIELVGLTQQRDVRAAKLSGGQRRRLDVACGVVGRPELLFLDEPTTGLDPVARRQAWDLVGHLRDLGTTVLLTTHYLDEAEALADRVGVIVGGRLVEVSSPGRLGGRATAVARVSFRAEGALAGRDLPPLPAESRVTGGADGATEVATARPTAVVAALAAWAAAAGVDEVPELAVSRPSLEEAYLRMVAAAGTAGTTGTAPGSSGSSPSGEARSAATAGALR